MTHARIYIVRHGETDENRNGILQGHLDTLLNADGIDQARRVAEALRDIPFDVAFTSDLSRAVKASPL
jgi:broad specificity phosphatase PhoE